MHVCSRPFPPVFNLRAIITLERPLLTHLVSVIAAVYYCVIRISLRTQLPFIAAESDACLSFFSCMCLFFSIIISWAPVVTEPIEAMTMDSNPYVHIILWPDTDGNTTICAFNISSLTKILSGKGDGLADGRSLG